MMVDHGTPALDLELPAVRESVPMARERVTAWVDQLNPSDEHRYAIQTVVTEAVGNVVVHAYRDRSDDPGDVRVQGVARNAHVTFCIEDAGIGMGPRLDSPGLGMGMPLMARLADDLEIICMPAREAGTEVRMTFDLGVDGAARRHLGE
jgi:serine/threonine-protein kinase RsbW